MSLDEFETVRLIGYQSKTNVARTNVTAIYASAYEKIINEQVGGIGL